jgi:hypothetical protein
MKWNKLYEYPKSIRSLINDARHYDIGEEKLPSVTTILSATQSDEKRASLDSLKNGSKRLAKMRQNVSKMWQRAGVLRCIRIWNITSRINGSPIINYKWLRTLWPMIMSTGRILSKELF